MNVSPNCGKQKEMTGTIGPIMGHTKANFASTVGFPAGGH
jgi:hypothetical protein